MVKKTFVNTKNMDRGIMILSRYLDILNSISFFQQDMPQEVDVSYAYPKCPKIEFNK